MPSATTPRGISSATAERFRKNSLSKTRHFESRRSAMENDDEYGSLKGTLSQYGKNGHGFVPTTDTTEKLPPGVYTIESVNDLWTFVPQKLSTDDLILLPDSESDGVIQEIDRFWNLGSVFKKFGFSQKRGFLLYGPPGSGKTSTISFIIQSFVKSNGIVLLADNGTSPDCVSPMLKKFRSIEPDRAILVVIEDIDTLLEKFGESELLSLLDGESSIDKIFFLATTNYPEKLDARITNRPSRFDRIIKIGTPNTASRKIYLESRKLGLTPDQLNTWVKDTEGFSIAHLKELIVCVMCFDKPYKEELERLKSMYKKINEDEDGFEKTEVGFGSRKSHTHRR